MKKNRLTLIKSLIITVFIILGKTTLAQHPLLGPDELNVYALPGSTVTLGKQAYDEGKTCYKWEGPFGGDDVRFGSMQVFQLPSFFSPNSHIGYDLTVIGEQYYEQHVTLHVIDEITFTVEPIRGCFSGNEIPVIGDFEIITTPSGYENLVSIDYDRCHQDWDGKYHVFFKLVAAGVLMDSHTVTVLNTDMVHNTTTYDVNCLGDGIRTLNKMVNLLCKGFRNVTGCGPAPDIPIPYGGVSITDGYDCCETTMTQRTLDIQTLGVKGGFHVDCAVPLYVLRAGIRGGFQLELGIRNLHTDLFRTCGPFDDEINSGYGAVSMSFGLFIEDGLGGLFLSATGDVVGKFYFEPWRMKIANSYTYTYGIMNAEMYIEAKLVCRSFVDIRYKKPIWGPKKIELGYRIDI